VCGRGLRISLTAPYPFGSGRLVLIEESAMLCS
jgi:hypothetical protein